MASRKRRQQPQKPLPVGPSPGDAYEIMYFRTAAGAVPARDKRAKWPATVRARVDAVLVAVAKAPPPRFSGGGMWQPMHDDMVGWHEVRVRYQKTLYRVFCRLDTDPRDPNNPAQRFPKNVLAVIDAAEKPINTALSPAFYAAVRALGDAYFKQNPRSWV